MQNINPAILNVLGNDVKIKYKIIDSLYRNFFRPLAFGLDAEQVHDAFTRFGEWLEFSPSLIRAIFSYQNPALSKEVLGVKFGNPIGLAAGFDYDGHLAKIMKYVGFGFNSVGTVTAQPYEGNPKPRLVRLPKSQSILVNKGFKSEGALAVRKRLDQKNLFGLTLGISVGSTNSPRINTINKAIDDYLFTFGVFKNRDYVKYFELNVSCPNTAMTESFTEEKNFSKLVRAVVGLKVRQPIFVKMPNEIPEEESDLLVSQALRFGVRGFIFSNLVKNRSNAAFDRDEIGSVSHLRGNFSGKPTQKGANKLIVHTRKKFGKEVALIGCGGIFGLHDALEKFQHGANLVQLITGMIYQGPQLAGEICAGLAAKTVRG